MSVLLLQYLILGPGVSCNSKPVRHEEKETFLFGCVFLPLTWPVAGVEQGLTQRGLE